MSPAQRRSAPAPVVQSTGAHSGINLGGIGTGGVEIRADGRFHCWNLLNTRPWAGAHGRGEPKGSQRFAAPVPAVMDADFLLRVEQPGRRLLYRWLFAGHGLALGTASHFYRHHKYFLARSIPRIEYDAEFPFARLRYVDGGLPVEVTLRAWTPFIPRDVRNSSLPGFFLDFAVRNRSRGPVRVSLLWQQQNLSGFAAPEVVQRHSLLRVAGARLVRMEGSLAAPGHETSGDMCLWARPQTGQRVTAVAANPYFQNLVWSLHRTGGLAGPLVPPRLQREELNATPRPGAPNKGWLCVEQRLAGGRRAEFQLGLSWFYPNHVGPGGLRLGHAYENGFRDSVGVARHLLRRREDLLARSERLPRVVSGSSLPAALRRALLDQLSTLTKSSHFARDGRFGLQEGHGCCAFNTVDVDHYGSYALSLLFPALRRKVLEMNLELAHPLNGKIHHGLPGSIEPVAVTPETREGYSRWDVCCQFVLQLYRDAKWSGDRALLRRGYPAARRAMDLVAALDFYGIGLPFIQGGITYDHWNMVGVVGYMAAVYLAALRALEDMARRLGDEPAATEARARFERGLVGFEAQLWNGRQYLLFYGRRPPGWTPADEVRGEHKLFEPARPPDSCCAPAGGPGAPAPACVEVRDAGVMTDLLNGHATAAAMGLGGFLDRDRVRRHLRLVLERNLQPETDSVVNGSYPDGRFPDEWPFMQWQTPWSGTEYYLALQLYEAGLVREGDRVVDLVERRHAREGMRWDHAECSNHYARPLSIWGAYVARLGLRHDALRRTLAIDPPAREPYRGALVLGTALGTLEFSATDTATRTTLRVEDGEVALRELALLTRRAARAARAVLDGRTVPVRLEATPGRATLRFGRTLRLAPGSALRVAVRS